MWTDEQIKNKPKTEIEAMVKSCEMCLNQLKESVKGEEERLLTLKFIIDRKNELGD